MNQAFDDAPGFSYIDIITQPGSLLFREPGCLVKG